MPKPKRSPAMITKVYSYQPATRNVTHVVEQRIPTEIVVLIGISGRIVRLSEMDTESSYYFTKPTLAIDRFIRRAEAAIAAGCDAEAMAAWKQALKTAEWDRMITTDPDD